MRYILLVGLREFAENVKTKGFWLGILVVPILITASVAVGQLLEKTTPTRLFVLIDPAGHFERPLEVAIARIEQRKVLEKLGAYLRKHADPSKLLALLDVEGGSPIPLQGNAVARFSEGDDETLEWFSESGGARSVLAILKDVLKPEAPPFEEPKPSFRRVALPEGIEAGAGNAALVEALKPFLRGERKIPIDGEEADLFAAIIVPTDALTEIPRNSADLSSSSIQYWSANLADDDLSNAVHRAVNDELRRRAFESYAVSAQEVRRIQQFEAPFTELNPKKEAGAEQVGLADRIRQWAPVGFVYFLWLAVFMNAQMLLNNMIEEKGNRLVEVLLSSVTPSELMLGKLLGIAGVGATVIASWVVYLFAFIHYKSDAEWALELLKVLKSTGLVPMFLLYFVLGYLLYAGVFLTIGSVCNTLKEAQNLMMPIVVIMIVPLITMEFIPKDPNGVVARVLSWIPIYTPFVMMNRAAADPPIVDRIGTLVLLVVTTLLVLALCGRIFRVGILRTGQPPKLLELLRWVRTSG